MPDYLNFELQISTLGDGVYIARVLDEPSDFLPDLKGPPENRFTFPFDATRYAQIMAVLSGSRRSRPSSTRTQLAQEFGEALFKAIFAGEVHKSYQDAYRRAITRGKSLRIRLNLSRAGELMGLPWEFLRDPSVGFLALSDDSPLVRHHKGLVGRERLKSALPLRILVMISTPTDLPPINIEHERWNLEIATNELQERGLVEILYLEDASLRALQAALRERIFHVFHYIGHGAFDTATRTGTLMLEDPYNGDRAVAVRGEALARELYAEDTLRLVLLNACQGAIAEPGQPFSGVASSLLQRGIPAVVAQQFEISDQAAIAFSAEFYQAVAAGHSLESAVGEARRGVANEFQAQDNVEWATPVLYLHDQQGERLFDFSQPRGLWGRLTNRQHGPQFVAALVALMMFTCILAGWAWTESRDTRIVSPPPPSATPIPNVDLTVTSIRLSPRNPAPGQDVAVYVDITNQGSDAAPAFTYEWQGNILDPTTTIARRVEGLAPNGVLHDQFTVRYGWWGAFIAQVRADTLQEIVERNENNSRPLPIRADSSAPLVVTFDGLLPDGTRVRGNQPLPSHLFEPWGFRVEAIASPESGCSEAVPWFKFVGISRVALGTGLTTNPTMCADAVLVITFLEERPDNNLSGVSSATVTFVPDTNRLTLRGFGELVGGSDQAQSVGQNSYASPLALRVDKSGLRPLFRVEIESRNGPLLVESLRFTSP